VPESRSVVLLGSTGSVGSQTLDVIDRLRQAGRMFEIVGLAAGANLERLSNQIEAYQPRAVSVAAGTDATTLAHRFPELQVVHGDEGPASLVRLDGVDFIVNALVGAVGLRPTLAALAADRTVALANKESLVIGGELVQIALSQSGGRLVPLDSEHSALFQCLEAGRRSDVSRLILTASGGPFLHTPCDALAAVTPAEALNHPNWTMGPRITVDSATLVNKAFEVIEAHYLFAIPYERIDVVIHPTSIVHSLVEYCDGSILAQLAARDMRVPIQYALTYPERVETGLRRLDLDTELQLSFRPLCEDRFPAFATVLSAAKAGGTALAAINAADEVLVYRFLHEEIPFTGIAKALEAVFAQWREEIAPQDERLSLPRLLEVDRWARNQARDFLFCPHEKPAV
jgi:1-deoxy-D-xylulose-5-phosphate reductoisomerase